MQPQAGQNWMNQLWDVQKVGKLGIFSNEFAIFWGRYLLLSFGGGILFQQFGSKRF